MKSTKAELPTSTRLWLSNRALAWIVTAIFTSIIVGTQSGWALATYFWMLEMILLGQVLCWTHQSLYRLRCRHLGVLFLAVFFVGAPLGANIGVLYPLFFGSALSSVEACRRGLAIGAGVVSVAGLLIWGLEIITLRVRSYSGRSRDARPPLDVGGAFDILVMKRRQGGGPIVNWYFNGIDEIAGSPAPITPPKPQTNTVSRTSECLSDYIKQIDPVQRPQDAGRSASETCFTFIRVSEGPSSSVWQSCPVASALSDEAAIFHFISDLETQAIFAVALEGGRILAYRPENPCDPVPYEPRNLPAASQFYRSAHIGFSKAVNRFTLCTKSECPGKHLILVIKLNSGDIFWECSRDGAVTLIQKVDEIVF